MIRTLTFSLALHALLSPVYAADDVYTIKTGDTLSEIAESRYGNWVKWRDLAQANADFIKNPNLIFPGQRLRLLSDEKMRELIGKKDAAPLQQPQEWSLLPLQSWEKFTIKQNPIIDPDGFDRRSRVARRVASSTTFPITIASDRLPILGEIVEARTEFNTVFLGQQVFIRPDEDLQVGETYSLTKGPIKVSSSRDGRVGFLYELSGKVKIIGVRDGKFIGTVVQSFGEIDRGTLLISKVTESPFRRPVAAGGPINASIILSPRQEKYSMITDQDILILDRGFNDGIEPGMIFRQYLYNDPKTKNEISAKDFLIESEIQVLDAKDQFSLAIVLSATHPIETTAPAIALTDLQDLNKHVGMQGVIQDYSAEQAADRLDQLDSDEGVGEKERRDLEQLEDFESEDIKREQIRSDSNNVKPLGEELAPNDGTNASGAQSLPPATPEMDLNGEVPTDVPPVETPSEPVEGGLPPAPEALTPSPENTLEVSPAESMPAPTPDPTQEVPAEIEGSTPPVDEPAPVIEN